ncbi:hypothetical protein [Parvularcula dongshanensis]|uniref:Cytochrome oxidase Cu insertion factor (SCO1/SenC/PrrC family) n=1 Tax=Parvularcula dongshanensis TaxID=1173995 RepID=A0A840HZR5_9PROT|nr:hypothetical protein [Parvularcula dongshanensis]MBB4657513.1 cytochrome oxidase Cu insertion factor (SCO1/SenC/PrrC family) [Parvularcula dongshanensis]
MAEIPVVKKSRFPWWAWVILVALILLALLFLLTSGEERRTADAPVSGSASAEGAVVSQSYVSLKRRSPSQLAGA